MENPLELRVGKLLSQKKLTLSTAESCTGGLIAHLITNVPGSSEYFLGGIVAYSNTAKAKLLNVSWDTLNAYGAVSEQTVIEMARGARDAFNADLAVSVSGVAGPGGGTPSKPVGTVWVGLAGRNKYEARHYLFQGNREENKIQSANSALQFVIEALEGNLI